MNKKWGLIFVTSIFRKFQQIITKFGKIHSLKVIYSLCINILFKCCGKEAFVFSVQEIILREIILQIASGG